MRNARRHGRQRRFKGEAQLQLSFLSFPHDAHSPPFEMKRRARPRWAPIGGGDSNLPWLFSRLRHSKGLLPPGYIPGDSRWRREGGYCGFPGTATRNVASCALHARPAILRAVLVFPTYIPKGRGERRRKLLDFEVLAKGRRDTRVRPHPQRHQCKSINTLTGG